MDSERFLDILGSLGCDFYTGVPDSLLSAFSAAIIRRYGLNGKHIIAANEGNAVGLAAGHYLATGKIPCVYLQNSGVGNIVNPVTSLLSDRVYGIPCIFIVGWRGEPGIPDEPQHAFMGGATIPLLRESGLAVEVLKKGADEDETARLLNGLKSVLDAGSSAAIVVEKGALTGEPYRPEKNRATLTREAAIACIVEASGGAPIVSTTGKASRELFELRERRGEGHGRDFLTVGSMGHCSSIALGVAKARPQTSVYCIDGDGAALMHLGALAVIGTTGPQNLIHIVINNAAHESVGGQPTAAGGIDLTAIAKACGYAFAETASDEEALMRALARAKSQKGPALIEARCAVGARSDLGRPTTTPKENKLAFMKTLTGEAE